MTTPQFIHWLDAKMAARGVGKARLYREAGCRHMSAADLLRLFIEEGLGLVKTEGRPAASKQQKTGQNLQKPAHEPHRRPRTAAAKAGKARPAPVDRPS
jgi:hypothetical protein